MSVDTDVKLPPLIDHEDENLMMMRWIPYIDVEMLFSIRNKYVNYF